MWGGGRQNFPLLKKPEATSYKVMAVKQPVLRVISTQEGCPAGLLGSKPFGVRRVHPLAGVAWDILLVAGLRGKTGAAQTGGEAAGSPAQPSFVIMRSAPLSRRLHCGHTAAAGLFPSVSRPLDGGGCCFGPGTSAPVRPATPDPPSAEGRHRLAGDGSGFGAAELGDRSDGRYRQGGPRGSRGREPGGGVGKESGTVRRAPGRRSPPRRARFWARLSTRVAPKAPRSALLSAATARA